MNKVYLEILVDQDVADEILVYTHPRVVVFKAEILTNENYDDIVTAHLKEEEVWQGLLLFSSHDKRSI